MAASIDTIGVIGRRVGDAAAVAAAIADDPAHFRAGSLPGLPRLGVLTDPFVGDIGPEMRDNLGQALQKLARSGAQVTTVSCPVDLALVHAAHCIITFAECAAEHLAASPGSLEEYGPRAPELIDLGVVTPAHSYLHAKAHPPGRYPATRRDARRRRRDRSPRRP